jgi:hypothetical protein
MAGGQGRQTHIHRLLNSAPSIASSIFHLPATFPIAPPRITLQKPIPRIPTPSFEWFQNHINNSHTPLILTGILSHWNALRTWNSPAYLLKMTHNGTRLVPIELGDSYVSSTWSQKLIPFREFLQHHLLTQSHPRGYLAQHNLLAQIPSLRSDIAIPEYCFVDTPERPPDNPQVPYMDTGGEVMENIWLGPEGTRSPLHNDPYENIFTQVVGYKYFRLYPPSETGRLYPRGMEGGIQMGNTSLVRSPPPPEGVADWSRLMWKRWTTRSFHCLRRRSMSRGCLDPGRGCMFQYFSWDGVDG